MVPTTDRPEGSRPTRSDRIKRATERIAGAIARIHAPLSTKLQGAFLVIILILLATAVVSVSAIARIERHTAELDRLDLTVTRAQRLDYSIVAQEHLSSMMLVTAEDNYYTKLVAERQRFRATSEELRAHGVAPAVVAEIEEKFAEYEGASEAVRRAKQLGAYQHALDIHVAQEHVIAHQIENLTRSLLSRTREARQSALTRILAKQRQTNWMVTGLFLLSISLAVVFSLLLARTIVHPIQTVDSALERIAGGEFTSVTGVTNRDELGSLVAHVNRMSQRLDGLYARERQATRELQEQVESVRQAQGQLVQAEKLHALGEMAGGVAHDFNNLLSVVLGQAEQARAQLARSELTSAEMDRRLGMIERAALDGAETVRRLFDFTRETPRSEEMLAVDVRELFASVVAVAEPRWKDEAHASGRPIEIIMAYGSVPTILGNPAELREVLLNLLFNALDAMPDGGQLTLASRTDGDRICLEVKDTGIGMAPEVASRIFEPFFTTKGPQSSGLGLSVSYGIVRRHGGDLTVNSRPGRGTTFTIALPIREVPPLEEAGVSTASSPESAGLRVLVVDDDDLVRQTLIDIFGRVGHHVSEVSSGREALDFLVDHPVDLVCTDLGMPGLTGLQLAPRIRREWPAIKIALVTGWGAQLDGPKLRAEGVDYLISKPFRIEHILPVLAEVAIARAEVEELNRMVRRET